MGELDGITTATFDCYGTLIDWEGGLGAYLYEWALQSGDPEPPPGRDLRERWEEIQFELIDGGYRPYRDVLKASIRELSAEREYRYNDRAGDRLLWAMGSWQPFPDTRPALLRAQAAGLRLAIISNCDRAIMQHTLRQLGIDFDAVVLAEDVHAYKPSERPFDEALQQLRVRPEEVLHVAFGFKYDIGTAAHVGMRTAWVNRKDEPRPDGAAPDLEWRDLWTLADATADRAS